MRRTDLQDTSLIAHRIMLRRLRQLTPEQKLRMTFDRIESLRMIVKAARS